MEDNAARIERDVTAWDGVTARPHRFGGTVFVLGGSELGHLHGSRWADIRFHRGVGEMLVETALIPRVERPLQIGGDELYELLAAECDGVDHASSGAR